MPHHTYTTKSEEKVVSMILPATLQWKDQIPKLNKANATFGLTEVSSSRSEDQGFESMMSKDPKIILHDATSTKC